MGGGWWEMKLEESTGMTHEEACRSFKGFYTLCHRQIEDFF